MSDSGKGKPEANGANRRQGRKRSRSPVDRARPIKDGSRDRRRGPGGGNLPSSRIIVKNLPYEIKWQTLKDIFRREVGDVSFVEVLEGPDGKSKGIAVIEFKDKEHAKKAIDKMHKFKVGDREIVVREERERDRQFFERQMGMDGRGMGGDMGVCGLDVGRGMDMPRGMDLVRGMDMPRGMDLVRGMDLSRGMDVGGRGMDVGGLGMGGGLGLGAGLGLGSGMGLGAGGGSGGLMGGGMGLGPSDVSPEILAQLGIDGPVTSTVFVANLDYQVTRWKLVEVFRLAGSVMNAEIKEDKNGKSRGMGIVEFEFPIEAVQAVSMFNGQTLFERKMMVRIDKPPPEEKPLPPKLPSGLKSIGMGLGSGGAPLTNLSQASGLGGGPGLCMQGAGIGGGLGAGGLGLGLDMGLGAGTGGLGGAGSLGGLGGLSGVMGTAGLGGAGSLGPSGSVGVGLGLGGGMGMGLGDSLGGSSSLGSSKMGPGLGGLGADNLGGVGMVGMGVAGLGGGVGMMGAAPGVGGLGGNSGLGGGLGVGGPHEGGGRGGFDASPRSGYDAGGRAAFDGSSRGGYDSLGRGTISDLRGRDNLDLGGRGGLDMGVRGGYDRSGLDVGLGGRNSGLDVSGRGSYDTLAGRGGLEDARAGFDSGRNIDVSMRGSGFDVGRNTYDSGMRGTGGFENTGRAGLDTAGRGKDTDGRSDRSGRTGGRSGGNCSILVRNLPYTITWQDLRDRFRDIGDVKYAEIVMDKGRPTGDALIRFGSEEDAVRAINLLDQTRLEGRTIRVVLRP